MANEQMYNPAMTYVRSLRDPIKRRYASEYLTWIRGGKVGSSPSRGVLAPAVAHAVTINLDELA